MFLPAILIPACTLSSLALHMMYSTYKLNKHDDIIQHCHIPFPILNQSIAPCPVLTFASCPAYNLLRRHIYIYIYIYIYMDFPGGATGKESTCQCRRPWRHGSISGSGKPLGGGNLLQYSCLKKLYGQRDLVGYCI